MTKTPIILERFVSEIQSVKQLDELNKIFTNYMNEIGMRYFTYHIVKIAGVGSELPYFITTYSDEWVKHYVDREYVKVDPLISMGPKRLLPFYWDEVAGPKHLKGDQVTLYKEAADLGIAKGISIPIHGHNGEFAMMSVVPDANPKKALQHLNECRNLLHLISLYYHNHAGGMLIEKYMGATQKRSALTQREKECLKWAAAGKTAWDISVILGISETGVLFHFENAKRKLGVVNRTQAVVKAIMLGLVQPM